LTRSSQADRGSGRPPTLIANPGGPGDPLPTSRRIPKSCTSSPRSETQEIAECFIAARTRADSLVAVAYQQLEEQTDRQFAALTDPRDPYRITVAGTGQATPYRDADELIASVSATRTLEVTTSPADRAHPLLSGEAGGTY